MARRLTLRTPAGARIALGLLLLALHLTAVERLDASLGAWRGRHAEAPRLQVVYLRPMRLSDPPARTAGYRAPPPHLLRPVVAPEVWQLPTEDAVAIALAAQPASAPAERAPPEPAPAALADVAVATAVEPPASAASAPPADGSDAPSAKGESEAPGFVWPASTRLSYVLTGNYRGEVAGSAQVEWINAEPRYQVNLDVTVGLPFAPLYKREMRSDGVLDRGGLHPRHFQQQSKLAFSPMRRIGLTIDGHSVTADDGRTLPAMLAAADADRRADHQTGVQDSASQFVQMTYLFTTQPQLLSPGTRIAFPLVLPSGARDWVYEVGQKETVYTRFGAIDAYRVRSASGLARGRDQLLAEAWFAPRLAHLPVRLRIEQQADLYLDMVLERVPELAGP